MFKTITFIFCLLLVQITVFSQPKVNKHGSFPLTIQYNGSNDTPLIFHLTGDGGAVRFDLKMFREYRTHGFSFIGLNSLKYFTYQKNPDKVAKDMIPVIQKYASLWHKKSFMLVGFSFGAEIVPFLYDKLPLEIKERSKLVVLLTPAKTSDFHIRMRDMIGIDKKNERYNVVNETSKITAVKVLAVYGNEEKPSLKESIGQPNLKVRTIKGGHGFKDSQIVWQLISQELKP